VNSGGVSSSCSTSGTRSVANPVKYRREKIVFLTVQTIQRNLISSFSFSLYDGPCDFVKAFFNKKSCPVVYRGKGCSGLSLYDPIPYYLDPISYNIATAAEGVRGFLVVSICNTTNVVSLVIYIGLLIDCCLTFNKQYFNYIFRTRTSPRMNQEYIPVLQTIQM